jgi:hypothetical protein
MSRRSAYIPRPSLRRFFVGFCAVAQLAVTIGFPAPGAVENPVGSTPFPCQDHHCGCRSADRCWRSCCCMSTQEKLAWAKEHGVAPPEYVVAAAKSETTAASSFFRQSAEVRTCCSSKQGRAVANRDADLSGQKPSVVCRPHAKVRAIQRAARPFTWVLSIDAQKCQGLATLWVATGAVLPPPPCVKVPVDSAPPRWWSGSLACHWQGTAEPPDVPPPRGG